MKRKRGGDERSVRGLGGGGRGLCRCDRFDVTRTSFMLRITSRRSFSCERGGDAIGMSSGTAVRSGRLFHDLPWSNASFLSCWEEGYSVISDLSSFLQTQKRRSFLPPRSSLYFCVSHHSSGLDEFNADRGRPQETNYVCRTETERLSKATTNLQTITATKKTTTTPLEPTPRAAQQRPRHHHLEPHLPADHSPPLLSPCS